MNKLTGAFAAVAMVAAAGSAIAAGNQQGMRMQGMRQHGMRHQGMQQQGMQQGTSEQATRDLGTLVQANLGEAATLRAELPSLRRDRPAVRVWQFMIRDHTKGAHMLAAVDRRLGGAPDMTPPAAEPAQGTPHAIIAKTLQAHLDTMRTVQGMQKQATGRELSALRSARAMVRHHIELLRSLARSSSHSSRRYARRSAR